MEGNQLHCNPSNITVNESPWRTYPASKRGQGYISDSFQNHSTTFIWKDSNIRDTTGRHMHMLYSQNISTDFPKQVTLLLRKEQERIQNAGSVCLAHQHII